MAKRPAQNAKDRKRAADQRAAQSRKKKPEPRTASSSPAVLTRRSLDPDFPPTSSSKARSRKSSYVPLSERSRTPARRTQTGPGQRNEDPAKVAARKARYVPPAQRDVSPASSQNPIAGPKPRVTKARRGRSGLVSSSGSQVAKTKQAIGAPTQNPERVIAFELILAEIVYMASTLIAGKKPTANVMIRFLAIYAILGIVPMFGPSWGKVAYRFGALVIVGTLFNQQVQSGLQKLGITATDPKTIAQGLLTASQSALSSAFLA